MNFKRSLLHFFVGSIIMLGCQDADFDDDSELNSPSDLNSTINPDGYPDSIPPDFSMERRITGNGGRSFGSAPGGVTTNGNDPINVAWQATVTATSTFCGLVSGILHCYDTDRINDGDHDTRLGPAYSWSNADQLPQSVSLVFGFIQMIDRIDIYTTQNWALQNYTISYRDANNNWTTLVTVTGNTSAHIKHDVGILQGVKEIKIECQRGSERQPQYARINEVEVFKPVFTNPPVIINSASPE